MEVATGNLETFGVSDRTQLTASIDRDQKKRPQHSAFSYSCRTTFRAGPTKSTRSPELKIKKLQPFLLLASLLAGCASAQAHTDAVMDALSDEMSRSLTQLHADPHPKPYFISYMIKEVDEFKLSSILGSPAVADDTRSRILIPDVRVGDNTLDSSVPVTTRSHLVAKVPLDDDYDAIRRAVWLNSDWYYKNIVRDFEWKKGYLSVNSVPDRLPEMTKETPTVAIDPIEPLVVDKAKWASIVERLAEVCTHYPSLQKSKVEFLAKRITRWFINSEGSKVRNTQFTYAVTASAASQAADGMSFSDFEVAAAQDESKLPNFDALKSGVEALAKRISDLR